jgi:hypothetical protein
MSALSSREAEVPLSTVSAPSNASPLWIIALFIALSEAVASIAAIATYGVSRLLFTYFATGFPLVVLTVFVWMLLKHPANLYSPGQYTEQTGIEAYVQALTRANRDQQEVITHAVAEAVVTAAETKSTPVSANTNSLREQVIESIDRYVDRASITVDRRFIMEDAEPVQIPVTEKTTVGSLLDSIFFTISTVVEPFTYGSSWVLADEGSELLGDMGTKWAEQHGLTRDTRSLKEVGIKPGSRLLVVPKSRPMKRMRSAGVRPSASS